jgi:hypothetical protein
VAVRLAMSTAVSRMQDSASVPSAHTPAHHVLSVFRGPGLQSAVRVAHAARPGTKQLHARARCLHAKAGNAVAHTQLAAQPGRSLFWCVKLCCRADAQHDIQLPRNAYMV